MKDVRRVHAGHAAFLVEVEYSREGRVGAGDDEGEDEGEEK